jgi:hypothetical protein
MCKWEDKGTEHKCLTTDYACNCNEKEITILFCKQIGQSPNTSYAKCRMGLREGKMKTAGNGFSSHPIFVSYTPCRQAVGLSRTARLPKVVEGGEEFALDAWSMLG